MTMYTLDNKEQIVASKPTFLNRMMIKLSAVFLIALSVVGTALGDIAGDLTNFTTIIGNATSGFTGFFVSMMTIFMTPPLLYFVTLGIFVTFVHLAAGFLMKRGRK